MAVRVARYRELCSECREPTDAACFRCKTPLCNRHLPDPTRRCAACEVEFRRWPSREPRVLAIGVVLVLVWVAVIAAAMDRSPVAAGLWALLFPLAAGALARRRLENGRAVFLRQEKRARAIADRRRIWL